VTLRNVACIWLLLFMTRTILVTRMSFWLTQRTKWLWGTMTSQYLRIIMLRWPLILCIILKTCEFLTIFLQMNTNELERSLLELYLQQTWLFISLHLPISSHEWTLMISVLKLKTKLVVWTSLLMYLIYQIQRNHGNFAKNGRSYCLLSSLIKEKRKESLDCQSLF